MPLCLHAPIALPGTRVGCSQPDCDWGQGGVFSMEDLEKALLSQASRDRERERDRERDRIRVRVRVRIRVRIRKSNSHRQIGRSTA